MLNLSSAQYVSLVMIISGLALFYILKTKNNSWKQLTAKYVITK